MTFEQWLVKHDAKINATMAVYFEYTPDDLQAAFEAGYLEGKEVGYDDGWMEGKRDTDEQWMAMD